MSSLTLERILPAPLETVFEFVTQRDHLLKWWGHEGMHMKDEVLDLSRLGPWHSEMISAEGNRYKMSGQVTRVSPPNLVAFTWGWHDEDDARGHESHVKIELEDAGNGQTKLTLHHADLIDDESAGHHKEGWAAILPRLAALFD